MADIKALASTLFSSVVTFLNPTALVGKLIGTLLPIAIIGALGYYGGYTKGIAQADIAINKFIVQQKQQEIRYVQGAATIETRVVTKYVDRIKTVEVNTHDNVQTVANNVPDTTTQLSNGWVYSYNTSLKAGTIEPAAASDGTSSGFTPNYAIQTIVYNNGQCEANIEQLKSLQDWINQSNALITKINGSIK